MLTMAAGAFKTHCLAVMDEVQARREPVVLTKNGRPVAKLVPLDLPEGQDSLDAFHFGKIEVLGDIVSPAYSVEDWEQFLEVTVDQLR